MSAPTARRPLERSSALPVPASRFVRGGTPGIDGGGAALDATTRGDMQAHFGRDFSAVRVHTGGAAVAAARSLSAVAYTVDRDIVFGAGRYAPQTPAGRRLLAHELAHVAQNDGAHAAGRAVAVGAPHDPLEAAADRAADAVARGAPVGSLGRASAPMLRRAPADGAPALPLLPPRLPPDSAQIDAGELLTGNPKLMAASATYIARSVMYGQATVRIHATIAPNADAAERAALVARMQAVSGALQLLRVPAFAIVVETPQAIGAASPGAVVVTVPKPSVPTTFQPSLLPATVPAPLAFGPQPGPQASLPSTVPPPVAPAALPKISLEFELGPLTAKLPKELQLKLEKALKGKRKLKFEVGYEAPAKFTLKLATEGLKTLDIALSSEVDVDTDKGVTTGKFGLTFSSAKKVCRAVDPAETQRALVEAGRKLNQSWIELQRMLAFNPASPAAVGKLVPEGPHTPGVVEHHSAADKPIDPPGEMDLLGKAAEVAGAIGSIYETVEKAKAKCKELSAVEVDLGYKRLLTPGSEKDVPKLPAKDVVGATLTIRF